MISKGKNKTAAEKEWLEQVVDFAQSSPWLSAVYSRYCQNAEQFQIDHILGAQAKRKINGVSVKVGEFAIMPIPFELHDITSNNPLNRTLNPATYREQFWHEKVVWENMIDCMIYEGYEIPFGDDLIQAVMRK